MVECLPAMHKALGWITWHHKTIEKEFRQVKPNSTHCLPSSPLKDLACIKEETHNALALPHNTGQDQGEPSASLLRGEF